MKSWICSGVSIAWLPAVPGSALLEGRVGETRVFGMSLPGPKMLVWADEGTIKQMLLTSAKNSKVRLVSAVEELGEVLSSTLPSISGLGHGSVIEGTKIDIDKDGKPSVSKTREIGFENDGTTKPKAISVTEAVAPAPEDEPK